MDKEKDLKVKYRPSIEIETILHHEQDAFEALFEVLGLSQEQIDRFNDLCNKKHQDRIDTEREVREILLQLIT